MTRKAKVIGALFVLAFAFGYVQVRIDELQQEVRVLKARLAYQEATLHSQNEALKAFLEIVETWTEHQKSKEIISAPTVERPEWRVSTERDIRRGACSLWALNGRCIQERSVESPGWPDGEVVTPFSRRSVFGGIGEGIVACAPGTLGSQRSALR